MAEPLLFDARIEELLRELAADPKSSLLRVPRPARLGVVLERKPLVGIATAGLTLAERELVRAHREELAYLLRRLAVVRLFESPRAATSLARTSFVSQPPLELRRSRLQEEIARHGGLEPLSPSAGEEAERILGDCVRGTMSSMAISVAALADAANRLDPTDQARIYHAQWAFSEGGDSQQATSILHGILGSRSSPTIRAIAETNLGRVVSLDGNPQLACSWYRSAAERCTNSALGACGWLTTALDGQNYESAAEAAVFLDQNFAADSAPVIEYSVLTRAQIEAGTLCPSEVSRRNADDIAASSTGPARAVAYAYLS